MFISSSHKTIFKVVLAFSKMPYLNRPYILRVFTVFLCDCTNGENSEIDKHTTYIFRHLSTVGPRVSQNIFHFCDLMVSEDSFGQN